MLTNRNSGTINLYLSRISVCMASNSGPENTSFAVPSTFRDFFLILPRKLQGCMLIFESLHRRLYLPAREDVKNPTRPPSSGTIQVRVETSAPDRRYVVDATYLSPAMPMCACILFKVEGFAEISS